MKPTFFGFESVRKALMASQMALDVTSQNVANVNTEGYTRQTVKLSSLSADLGSTKFARTAGEIGVGQGVDITGIVQNRDQFLDARYRKENAQYGKWSTTLSIMTDVENVLDETSTDGLNSRLTDFYNQLQSFSTNADSIEYASNFRSSAQKVVDVFNQYAERLSDIKDQQTINAKTDLSAINNLIDDIKQLNIQIKEQYIQGTTPNELLDSRNLDIDKLSGLCGASYELNTDGQISIKLGESYLLNSQNDNEQKTLSLDDSGYPITILSDGAEAEITSGSLYGYLTGLNGEGVFADSGASPNELGKGIIYFQKSLDSLAKVFADNFNQLNDSSGGNVLFDGGESAGEITAANIRISDDWTKDAQFITRSTSTESKSGSNDNLLRMVNSMETKQYITPYFNGTFEEYATSIIGDMATELKYDKDMQKSSDMVLSTISNQRESIMGVSTDEEAINMIKYQRSYSAAARLMTAMDEILDVLISKTGMVGR